MQRDVSLEISPPIHSHTKYLPADEREQEKGKGVKYSAGSQTEPTISDL